MVALIMSVLILFWPSDLTSHLEDTGLSIALCYLILRRPSLEVATKNFLHPQVQF